MMQYAPIYLPTIIIILYYILRLLVTRHFNCEMFVAFQSRMMKFNKLNCKIIIAVCCFIYFCIFMPCQFVTMWAWIQMLTLDSIWEKLQKCRSNIALWAISARTAAGFPMLTLFLLSLSLKPRKTSPSWLCTGPLLFDGCYTFFIIWGNRWSEKLGSARFTSFNFVILHYEWNYPYAYFHYAPHTMVLWYPPAKWKTRGA